MRTEKEIIDQIKHFEKIIKKKDDKLSRDYMKIVAKKQSLEWVLDIE